MNLFPALVAVGLALGVAVVAKGKPPETTMASMLVTTAKAGTSAGNDRYLLRSAGDLACEVVRGAATGSGSYALQANAGLRTVATGPVGGAFLAGARRRRHRFQPRRRRRSGDVRAGRRGCLRIVPAGFGADLARRAGLGAIPRRFWRPPWRSHGHVPHRRMPGIPAPTYRRISPSIRDATARRPQRHGCP